MHPYCVGGVELQLRMRLAKLYERLVEQEPRLLGHLDRNDLEARRLELAKQPVNSQSLMRVHCMAQPPLQHGVAKGRLG